MNNQRLKHLITVPVVSRETGKHLGWVSDVLVDTLTGKLKGFCGKETRQHLRAYRLPRRGFNCIGDNGQTRGVTGLGGCFAA